MNLVFATVGTGDAPYASAAHQSFQHREIPPMMRQYELVERVQRYKPDVNEALLNKAYVYAMQKHGHQKRASGDPYFSHPLEVAAILTEMHMDEATIAVALLHDTIEDTTATRAEIDDLFGPEMGKLVEGLTKLKKLDLVSKKAEQAENLRKLLLAISEDVRVLLVKLADRLHNMRTLDHMPEAKRLRIAEETMDIYAPLAGRMGMQGMREELEEIAFRFINPEAYRAVTARLAEIFERNKGVLSEIEKSLSALFEKHAINAGVKSRQKKPWSVIARSAPSTRRGRWCPAASRITSRRPSRTTTARSTPPSSARRASVSNCRSALAR
jgi:guanosine-3',5'-bis(diphosphate) 3'-pyrophosphohydrolase